MTSGKWSEQLVKTFNLSATLQRILTESLPVLDVDRAALFLWQAERNTLAEIRATFSMSE